MTCAPGANIGARNDPNSTVWAEVQNAKDIVIRFESRGASADKATLDKCQQIGVKAIVILTNFSASNVKSWCAMNGKHPALSSIYAGNEQYGTWTGGPYNGADYFRWAYDGLVEAKNAGIPAGLTAICTSKGDSTPDSEQWLQHLLDGAASKNADITKLCAALDAHPYTGARDPNDTSRNGFKGQLLIYNAWLDQHAPMMDLVLSEWGLASKGSGPNTVDKIVGAGASTATKEAAVQAYFKKCIALLEDPVIGRYVKISTMYMALDGGNQSATSQEYYFGRRAGYNPGDRAKPHRADHVAWSERARAKGATGLLDVGAVTPPPPTQPPPTQPPPVTAPITLSLTPDKTGAIASHVPAGADHLHWVTLPAKGSDNQLFHDTAPTQLSLTPPPDRPVVNVVARDAAKADIGPWAGELVTTPTPPPEPVPAPATPGGDTRMLDNFTDNQLIATTKVGKDTTTDHGRKSLKWMSADGKIELFRQRAIDTEWKAMLALLGL